MRLLACFLSAFLTAKAGSLAADNPGPRLVSQGLSGYVSMDVPAPPDDYGYGVSLYSTAWPLLERPLRDFQIGLASIWIVPEETGLKEARFQPALTNQAYTSPESGNPSWKKPGPKAGPCQARLSDGSVVTYWWYRFIDQPSLQDADLSDADPLSQLNRS
jgi:hypothetical protein